MGVQFGDLCGEWRRSVEVRGGDGTIGGAGLKGRSNLHRPGDLSVLLAVRWWVKDACGGDAVG